MRLFLVFLKAFWCLLLVFFLFWPFLTLTKIGKFHFMPTQYPCSVCSKSVNEGNSIFCDSCNLWTHFKCSGLSLAEFHFLYVSKKSFLWTSRRSWLYALLSNSLWIYVCRNLSSKYHIIVGSIFKHPLFTLDDFNKLLVPLLNKINKENKQILLFENSTLISWIPHLTQIPHLIWTILDHTFSYLIFFFLLVLLTILWHLLTIFFPQSLINVVFQEICFILSQTIFLSFILFVVLFLNLKTKKFLGKIGKTLTKTILF